MPAGGRSTGTRRPLHPHRPGVRSSPGAAAVTDAGPPGASRADARFAAFQELPWTAWIGTPACRDPHPRVRGRPRPRRSARDGAPAGGGAGAGLDVASPLRCSRRPGSRLRRTRSGPCCARGAKTRSWSSSTRTRTAPMLAGVATHRASSPGSHLTSCGRPRTLEDCSVRARARCPAGGVGAGELARRRASISEHARHVAHVPCVLHHVPPDVALDDGRERAGDHAGAPARGRRGRGGRARSRAVPRAVSHPG